MVPGIDSRLRGNDEIGDWDADYFAALRLCAIKTRRRPSAGWGLSRLSTKRGAMWLGGIGPSLQPKVEVYPERPPYGQSKGWGDGVLGFEAVS